MLKHLKIKNVGPASSMELELGERLNIITGDNGLGKSFLLDIAWWALTRKWPAEINSSLTSGAKAKPVNMNTVASIDFSFTGKSKSEHYISNYQPHEQAWTGRPGRPSNPGLIFYAMADGSFALWDPARNFWLTRNGVDIQERPPAYVFSPKDVWDGLQTIDGSQWLCNGLIRDWASWQRENGSAFKLLCAVLKVLSPSENEQLYPGALTRISLDDARDIPTIRMPYGQDVPVIHASSGMRRVMALAYFLVWAWEEHHKAASWVLSEPPTHQAVLLIDEVEAHLHPQWQRRIIPALLKTMNELAAEVSVQLIATTHSPLIMASVEPIFNDQRDAWFDLDLEGNEVALTHRKFENHGDVSAWLMSEAFDLPSARSLEAENLIREASNLLDQQHPNINTISAMNDLLNQALSPEDDYLQVWRHIGRKKGLLK